MLKKILASAMVTIMVLSGTLSCFASGYQMEQATKSVENIKKLVSIAEKEKLEYGDVKEVTAKQLENELKVLGIKSGPYSETKEVVLSGIVTRGYGETHNLGQGWTYRVDRTSAGDAKPHVHVDNNKLGVHGVENVDGTPSHKKTLKGSGVPKGVEKAVKGS